MKRDFMNLESVVGPKFYVSLLLFGSAIVSLIIGLAENSSVIQFKFSYLGALVLAVLGIIVLTLPTRPHPITET